MLLVVRRQDSIGEALAQIESQSGRLDMLVNNAGYGQFGEVVDTEPDAMRRQFETDVVAPVAVSRAFLPVLRVSRQA